MNESPMNIVWFVSHLTAQPGGYDSVIASVRLRCLIPAAELERSYEARVSLVHLTPDVRIPDAIFRDTDVAVFGKIFHDWKPLYQELERHGIPVVVDVCDDVFTLPHLKKNYTKLLPRAVSVVVGSEYLGERVREKLGVKPVVVPDAVEGERRSPAVELKRGDLRLAWFGQPMNLPGLLDQLPALAVVGPSIHLDVVTRLDAEVDLRLETAREMVPTIRLDAHAWSRDRQEQVLMDCDVVLIPSGDDDRHKVKTANRLITALWAGKPVVAHPLPANKDFSEFAILNPSTEQGLGELISLPSERVEDMIRRGQEYTVEHFSPDRVAARWKAVLDEVVFQNTQQGDREPGPETVVDSSVSEPIRLNLGCGDKILDGYVNVDLVDERRGNRPDVVCDIRDLSVFSNDYADEILSVHVVEHFYYWEIVEVLKEWLRVLKPGGLLTIETPNLRSACREILERPDTSTDPGPKGRYGMWPLYGDPSWKDPLMCHRWLYTPQSLTRLLSLCGLTEISQEPARFKAREPRDMRIVARKPAVRSTSVPRHKY